MNPYSIDVPVALIFFNRPEPLKEVFEAIKRARPSTLFLIQDGARDNRPDDLEKIQQCRAVVDNIDWECKVYRNYSEKNLGCGMRIYSGIAWCFEYVDRLCIIEDDCVPSMDYFRFCAELLERYKDDQRIDMICGMNNLGTYDTTPYSYFFAGTGSVWGWATWKRVWDKVDFEIAFIEDKDAIRLLKNSIFPKRLAKRLIENGLERRNHLKNGGKLSSWSYQKGMTTFLQSALLIIPHKNLITNIGLTNDSVHAVNSVKKLPKAKQQLFNMRTYELEFPLRHPKYVVHDFEYDKKINKTLIPNIFITLIRKIEGIIRRLIFK